jgi:hypothetical protein
MKIGRLRFSHRFWRSGAWALIMLLASVTLIGSLWAEVWPDPFGLATPEIDESEIPFGFLLISLAIGLAGFAGYIMFELGRAICFAASAVVADANIVVRDVQSLSDDGSTRMQSRIELEYRDRNEVFRRMTICHPNPARWSALTPGMTVVGVLGRKGELRLPGELMVLPSVIDPREDLIGPHIPG